MSALTPRRAALLRELGIAPLWRLRSVSHDGPDLDVTEGTEGYVAASATLAGSAAPIATASHPAPSVAEVLNESRTRTSPQQPTSPSAVATIMERPTESPPVTDPHRVDRIAHLDWAQLESEIRDCRSCVLCEKRKQAVPGVGDRSARWMLVGEGPGAEEDQRGEPFVGQAGRLLDNMLAAVGLKREEGVYIANAVKCRPPHNRTPEAGEIAACRPFLERQIALVQPRLLIALGRPAALALLNTEVSIGAARGKRFERNGTPVVVTYHPAYLLRNPQDKGKAWEDLCLARRLAPPT